MNAVLFIIGLVCVNNFQYDLTIGLNGTTTGPERDFQIQVPDLLQSYALQYQFDTMLCDAMIGSYNALSVIEIDGVNYNLKNAKGEQEFKTSKTYLYTTSLVKSIKGLEMQNWTIGVSAPVDDFALSCLATYGSSPVEPAPLISIADCRYCAGTIFHYTEEIAANENLKKRVVSNATAHDINEDIRTHCIREESNVDCDYSQQDQEFIAHDNHTVVSMEEYLSAVGQIGAVAINDTDIDVEEINKLGQILLVELQEYYTAAIETTTNLQNPEVPQKVVANNEATKNLGTLVDSLVSAIGSLNSQMSVMNTKMEELNAELPSLAVNVDVNSTQLNNEISLLNRTISEVNSALESFNYELDGMLGDSNFIVDPLNQGLASVTKSDFILDRLIVPVAPTNLLTETLTDLKNTVPNSFSSSQYGLATLDGPLEGDSFLFTTNSAYHSVPLSAFPDGNNLMLVYYEELCTTPQPGGELLIFDWFGGLMKGFGGSGGRWQLSHSTQNQEKTLVVSASVGTLYSIWVYFRTDGPQACCNITGGTPDYNGFQESKEGWMGWVEITVMPPTEVTITCYLLPPQNDFPDIEGTVFVTPQTSLIQLTPLGNAFSGYGRLYYSVWGDDPPETAPYEYQMPTHRRFTIRTPKLGRKSYLIEKSSETPYFKGYGPGQALTGKRII